MTPGYVAHSWDIPRDVMQAELADMVAPDAIMPGARKTLDQIADENDLPVDTLIERIEAVIGAQRAGE